MTETVVVAIPAQNEAERIGSCLAALDRQQRPPDTVLLYLNNCNDETETVSKAMMRNLGYRLQVISCFLPPERANAGHARRLAMQEAASLAEDDTVLMTTDADSVVPPDWVVRNLAALHQGIDVVCGRAIMDPAEAALIPPHIRADEAMEHRLIGLLDQLAWILDPEPHDPWPRHMEASGASLAVRGAAFHDVGGIPAQPCGEDRAFVRALWMRDALVRHDPAIRVTVSGRTAGRAVGGMADTLRRRITQPDEWTDSQIEPALNAFRRYALRRHARLAWLGARSEALGAELNLSQRELDVCLAEPFFGAAWAALEGYSPVLQQRRVRFADLASEIVTAEGLIRDFTAPEILAAD